MPLPGFIEVHNCLPYDLDFQCDARQYTVKSHTAEVMTVSMAMQCIKKSMYKLDTDGIPYYGAVIIGDPHNPVVNLTNEDLQLNDPIASSVIDLPEEITLGGVTYGAPRAIKVSQPNLPTANKKHISRDVVIQAGGVQQ